jgi:hypothetical protein
VVLRFPFGAATEAERRTEVVRVVIPQRQFQVVAFDDSLPYQRSGATKPGKGIDQLASARIAVATMASASAGVNPPRFAVKGSPTSSAHRKRIDHLHPDFMCWR